MWVLEIKLRVSGSATSTLVCGALSLALSVFLLYKGETSIEYYNGLRGYTQLVWGRATI